MKKQLLIFALMLMAVVSVFAQKVVKKETLKTTDLGNQKLEVVINGQDTTYAVALKTGNMFQKYIIVGLGGTDQALKLLEFLENYESQKGDIIDFENPTGNTAKYQGASGYLVYSEGGHLSGHLRKPNIRGFIKEIKSFSHR